MCVVCVQHVCTKCVYTTVMCVCVPQVCAGPRKMEKDLDLSYRCMSIKQCGSWKQNLVPLAVQQGNTKLYLLLT